jgi:hypothetical protein
MLIALRMVEKCFIALAEMLDLLSWGHRPRRVLVIQSRLGGSVAEALDLVARIVQLLHHQFLSGHEVSIAPFSPPYGLVFRNQAALDVVERVLGLIVVMAVRPSPSN